MHLTQGQVREALQIGPETFRHWRKALPPLVDKTGHAPQFSRGDLLALAVVKEWVDVLGMNVGALTRHGNSLFQLCHSQSWKALSLQALYFDGQTLGMAPSSQFPRRLKDTPACVIVSLGPMLDRLERRLSEGQSPLQGDLFHF
jgi:hypothetical protein